MQALYRTVSLDSCAVAGGCIAHVDFEPVINMYPPAIGHHVIAHYLGDDGGGGDRLRTLIALDQGATQAGQTRRNVAAIGERKSGLDGKGADGAAHGFKAGLADVACIDAFRADGRYADGAGGAQHPLEQGFALSMAEAFGIVQSDWNIVGIQHHRCRHNRTRERASPSLIHSCHRPQPFGSRGGLEREVGALDDIEEEWRIGA